MACLDDNTVVALLERRLDAAARARAHEHLDGCPLCRELVGGAAEAWLHREEADDDLTLWLEHSDSAVLEAPVIEPGTLVDHYRVVRRIGSGGMGQVYLALDTLLERKVALKMVHPTLLEHERALERFFAEARTTAKLNHPNIVTIHAVGQHADRPYVALELLSGQTLRERLAHGPLAAVEAAQVMLAVARALETAHAAGVCHRDLKPGNVMLGVDGRVCVLDFGLAKVIDHDSLETTWIDGAPSSLDPVNFAATSTLVGGTPAYMAPEQWHGSSTNASDLWALGVMIYEACAGMRPFDARPGPRPQRLLELVRAVTQEPAPGLGAAPQALDALVARCLAKDPAARPSASEAVEALEQILSELAPASAPASQHGSGTHRRARVAAAPPAKRRWWIAAGLAAGAAVAMALAWPAPEARVAELLPTLPAASPKLEAPEPEARAPEPVRPPIAASATSSPPAARPAAPAPGPAATSSHAPWDPLSYR